MAGVRTIPVAKFLREAGFTVWTPVAHQRRRRPRSTKYHDIVVPAFSTFVFAAYEHLPDLLALQHAPVSSHPEFRVMQRGDRAGRVADQQLAPLRAYEAQSEVEWQAFLKQEEEAARERARRKKSKKPARRANARRSYVLGQRVQVLDPAFQGLDAEIIEMRKDRLKIVLNGLLEIEVETCDIEPSQLDDLKPEQAKAA